MHGPNKNSSGYPFGLLLWGLGVYLAYLLSISFFGVWFFSWRGGREIEGFLPPLLFTVRIRDTQNAWLSVRLHFFLLVHFVPLFICYYLPPPFPSPPPPTQCILSGLTQIIFICFVNGHLFQFFYLIFCFVATETKQCPCSILKLFISYSPGR